MPRLSLILTACAAIALQGSAQTSAGKTESKLPPGFHVAEKSEIVITHPSKAATHPKPAPLSEMEISTELKKRGGKPIHISLPGVYTPNLQYQLELFNNQVGAEVETSVLKDSNFYGASGYVQVDFNVLAGKQYLLDCSLGMDGTYSVVTAFVKGENGTPWLGGTFSSYNRHLLIPYNPTPNGWTDGRAVISFKAANGIEFDGCQVETVTE